MEIKILYEDSDILVLDKPSGIVVNRSDTTKGEKTVQEWVEEYLKIPNPKFQIPNKSKNSNSNIQNSFEFRDPDFEFFNRSGIVHRLDKETSGILLVAKNPQSFENLQKQFKERKVNKTYIALVHGELDVTDGKINVPVGRLPWNRKRFGVLSGGREAITKYKVLSIKYLALAKQMQPLTLLELYPQTGRTHQIRVHLKYINHPIFSDHLYAGRKIAKIDRNLLPRIFLHASQITFSHPISNKVLTIKSEISADLNHFLQKYLT